MSLVAHTWFVCPDPMVCALLIRRLTKKNKLSCYFVEHIYKQQTAFASGSLGFASQKPWCLKQLLLLLLWIEHCCVVQLVGAITHRILCIQLHRRASLWQRATSPPSTCGRTVGQIIFSVLCLHNDGLVSVLLLFETECQCLWGLCVCVCLCLLTSLTSAVWVLKPAPTSELQPSNATVTILIESHTVLQIVQDQMLAWGKRRHVWTFLYLVFLLPICFLPAFVRALKKSPKTIDLPNCSGFGAADGVTVSRRKNKRRPTV